MILHVPAGLVIQSGCINAKELTEEDEQEQ